MSALDSEWKVSRPRHHRRRWRPVAAGLTVATLGACGVAEATPAPKAAAPPTPPPVRPPTPQAPGKSPWGYETYKEPTSRPLSVRPAEQKLPTSPRKYTDIKSYHAHVYFDEDTYEKTARLRSRVFERFSVTNDLLPVLVPWRQLNRLGLTILLHPNTEDPRADHLYDALWVNRSQPVNAYAMNQPGPGEPAVEQIYPNTKPTRNAEV